MKLSPRVLGTAAGLFLLCSIVSGIGNLSLSNQLAVAKADLQEMADSAKTAAIRAGEDARAASDALARAERAADVRRGHIEEIDAAVSIASETHAAATVALTDVPAGCEALVAVLQADNDAIAGVAAAELEALNHEILAHEQTKADLARASADLAAAQLSLAGLAVRAENIELPGTSFLERLLPKAGIGVAAGITPDGRFATVAGLTLGWRIDL